MAVMQRLHEYLLQQQPEVHGIQESVAEQSSIEGAAVPEPPRTEAAPASPAAQTPSEVAEQQHAPTTLQSANGWRSKLQACMSLLDKLILATFTLLSLIIAYNVVN
jgi:hypothetical protein